MARLGANDATFADLLQTSFLLDIAARGLAAEQLERLDLVVGDRRERRIHVVVALRIALHPLVDAPQAEVEGDPAVELPNRLHQVHRIEPPDRLARPARAPVAARFAADEAALDRVDA